MLLRISSRARRSLRHSDYFRHLTVVQSAEVAQLDDLAPAGVNLLNPSKA